MNSTSPASGSIAGPGGCGGGRSVGRESHVNNELVEVGGFWKKTEGGLVRRSWVDGLEKRTWRPSLIIRLRR